MVRQMSAESGEGYSIWVDTNGDRWPRPDQFELLCSFAATLAEDLFTAGKLRAVAVGRDSLMPVRRLRDLEQFLDRLALSVPNEAVPSAAAESHLDPKSILSFVDSGVMSRRNLLTFTPDGARGVAAYVNGEKTAAA
jgi:hypothetical protein